MSPVALRNYSHASLMTRISAARFANGTARRVMLPAGRFTLESMLDLDAAGGLVLEGAGEHATQLVVGAAMTSGILFSDTRESGLAHLTVTAQAPVQHLVRMTRRRSRAEQAVKGTPTPTANTMCNVTLDGGAYMRDGAQLAWAAVCLALDGGQWNENGDCATFVRLTTQNYRTAGVLISGNQSKEHLFIAPRFNGNGIGRAGIWSNGGGWRMIGGGGAGHSMADVVLEDAGDSITLVGAHFETSRRFIFQPNRTGTPMSVTLIGCEWMADQLDPLDGEMILMRGPGPLAIQGGHFGSGKQPLPHVRLDPHPDEPCAFTCVGATFGGFGAAQAPESPFRLPYRCDRHIVANLYADGRPQREGMAVVRPEWSATGWDV